MIAALMFERWNMSGAVIPSAIASQGRPPRIKRQPLLLSGCAVAAALAVTGQSAPVRAQAFQGTPTTVSGTVSFNRTTPNIETITVDSPTAIVNWTPTDTAIGGGTINYLPAGATATYTSTSGSDFTILNRILPTDTTRPVGFFGTVVGNFVPASGPTTPLGNIWFYSPGGIIAGATSVFDVGSLVLTAADIDTSGGLFGPGNTIRFRAAADSRAMVDIQAGAQITASRQGSYVALVAPRVRQGGTVNVNGSAAYVAAESVDISINGGLFDIAVQSGSNVNAGGETTLEHSGTTTGPGPTDGTDPQTIYMVAIPKNDAVTMLLTGSAGYGAAGTVGIENGAVVLSAGYGFTSSDSGIGNAVVSLSTPPTTQNASISIQGGSFGSRVTGYAVTDAAASGGGGTLAFASALDLTAGRNASLIANNGETITVAGSMAVRTKNADSAGNTVAGTAAIRALGGGTITVLGGATADASGGGIAGSAQFEASGGSTLDLGRESFVLANASGVGAVSAQGGTATVLVSNGTLNVGEQLQVTASAIQSSIGGNATGGTASVTVSGGTLSVGTVNGGPLLVNANAQGGMGSTTGSDGQGGTAQVSVNSGTIDVAGSLIIGADGQGGSGVTQGGLGRGGTASLSIVNGDVSAGGLGVVIARGLGGAGLNGGNGFGGSASFVADDGSFQLGVSGEPDDLFIVAGAVGGTANDGGTAGSGTGGSATFNSLDSTPDGTPSIITVNTLTVAAGGTGGAFTGPAQSGGNGGIGTGGGVALTVSAGDVNATNVTLLGDGVASNGNNAVDSANGGAGGNATGGGANLSVSGGSLTVNSLTMTANADAGDGGNVFESGYGTPGGSGGNGGNAIAGNVTASFSGGTVSGTSLLLEAAGFGGSGGSSSETPGSAGFGRGATAEARVVGGQISFDSVDIDADGDGGFGGNSANQTIGSAGGAGQAGTARFLISSGSATITSFLSIGGGEAGEAGGGGFGADFVQAAGAGASNGGASELLVSGGTLTAGQTSVSATATGVGDSSQLPGGDVRGGNALLAISGGSASFTSTVFVTASAGLPVEPEAAGAAAFGGSATVSLTNGVTATFASGLDVRADAANGSAFNGAVAPVRGGTAAVTVDGTLDLGTNSLFISANGFGTSSPLIGGAAAGGNASLTLNGGSIIATFASIIADAAGGLGDSVFDSSVDAGAGGSATGGSASLSITGGTFLPTSLTISAIGTGGRGGDATDGPNGGAGGVGTGGTASLNMSGGTLGDANLSGITVAGFGLGGDGGDALESGYGATGGNGGAGGNSSGGTSQISITGGTLIASSVQGAAYNELGAGGSSVSGNGGNGGNGTGGTSTFFIDGASTGVTIDNLILYADGNGALGGDSVSGTGGIGGTSVSGLARLDIRDGTVNLNSLTIDTSSFNSAPNDATGGTSELLISGGTTTLGLVGLSANAFVNFSQQRDGAVLRGGTARVAVSGGTANFTGSLILDASATFENDGVNLAGGDAIGGQAEVTTSGGSTASFNSLTMFATARSGFNRITGVSGTADGGNILLASNGASLGSVSLFADARAADGAVRGGDAIGGSINVVADGGAFSIGTINADVSATAGNGLDGATGSVNGGDGGNATGGFLSLRSEGVGSTLSVSSVFAQFVAQAGTGGNGLSGTIGGAGGDGGSANGGGFDAVADLGALGAGEGSLALSIDAIAGVGGNGGDGSDVGNTGGIGGNGGSASGGVARVTVNGGTANLGFISFSAQGTGATGGAGGTGAGDPNAVPPIPATPAANGTDGSGQGGLVSIQVNDSGGQAGSASIDGAQFSVAGRSFNGEFGDQVGRVELYDNGNLAGGGLTFGSLSIFDDGIASTSDQAVDFFAASRRISITGDASIQTPGFVYFRADGTGGTDIGGLLDVSSGGSIFVDHSNQVTTPVATVQASQIIFNATGGSFQASTDSLVRSTGTSTTPDPVTGEVPSGIRIFAPTGITAGNLTSATDITMVNLSGGVDVNQIDAGRAVVIFSGARQNNVIAGPVRLGTVKAGGLFYLGDIAAAGQLSPTNIPIIPVVDDIQVDDSITAGSIFMGTDGAITGGALTATTGVVNLRAGSASLGDVAANGSVIIDATGAVDATSVTAGTGGAFSFIDIFTDGTVDIGTLTADTGDIDVEGGSGVTIGSGSAGHALTLSSDSGSVTAGALTTGSLPFGGFEEFDGVGIKALTGIDVGPVSSGLDVGMVSLGDISVDSIDAARDVVLLPGGSLNVGGVTAGSRFYVANATMLPTVEPDPDAPVDFTVLDSVAFDPIGGSATIGAVDAGIIRVAALGGLTTGDLTAHAPAGTNRFSAIELLAAGSATLGNVTTDFGDIEVEVDGSLNAGAMSAGDSVRLLGGGTISTGALVGGTFDGAGVTGYLGSVGAATFGNVSVGDVTARNDIGLASGASVVAGDLTAGRDAGVLAAGDITIGTVTNPGVFYISNASILASLGITEPALEDIPTILAATPVATGGDLTIGTLSTGSSIAPVGGDITIGTLISTDAITFNAANSFTVGTVTSDADITINAGRAITVGTGTAAGNIILASAPNGNARFALPDAARTITAGSLDAGGNVDVNAQGAIDIGSADAGGRMLVVSATTVAVDTASAAGDILLDGAASITVGTVIGQRDVELVTDIRGGDTDLTLPRSINVDSAEAGDDLVVAAFGSVTAGSLTSNGTGQDGTTGLHGSYTDVAGSNVLVIGEKGVNIDSIDAAAGVRAVNVAEVRNGVQISDGSGGITIDSLITGADVQISSAASAVTVNSVQVNGTVSAQSTDITLNAPGNITLRNIVATGTAAVDSVGLLTINGIVAAPTIDLSSGDIAISQTSLIGNANTQTIRLANSSEGPSFIGGTDTDGWTLSNAEFATLQAHDIDIFNTFDTIGSPDMIVRDLTIKGSAFVSSETTPGRANLLGSTLSIRAEAGSMVVEGNVQLQSAGADDVLELSAEDRIQVVTPTGSIAITDASGALGGTLRMDANRVFIGSSAAFDDVFPDNSSAQPTIGEITDRLGVNDGDARPEGFLQAGAMQFDVADSLFIQNSGASNEAGSPDRAGFTVGTGGLAIGASSNTRIVVNGRQAAGDTANPFITGEAMAPVVAAALANSESSAAQGSTVNGCIIRSVSCSFEIPEQTMTETTNTPGTVLQEVVEKAEEEADDGTQVIQQLNLPLIRFVDFSGLGFTPVIDEPVTGTGNDDLWMGGPGGGK
jgi:hypothetical protein